MTSTSLRSLSKRIPTPFIDVGSASVRWTGRTEGDLGISAGDPGVAERRQAVFAGEWSWCHQVHGAGVHVVTRPGSVRGADGDALVTAALDAPLAIFTADCAPVAFGSANGVAGVAHAGWRGLRAGILQATVSAMRDLGAVDIVAALGPCIRAECYEFGADDLADVSAHLGTGVRALTSCGRPALDVPAGVTSALADVDVVLIADAGVCTACSREYFSHRARRDPQRQATVVVLK
ncbi:MAG: peptidoglycan editing factor PgeF [Acidimicrobiales bacterium]